MATQEYGGGCWTELESTPLESRFATNNIYEMLQTVAKEHGDKPALSFQLRPSPTEKAVTYNYREYNQEVTRAANLFHSLGVKPGDTVACILPNTPQTVFAMLGAMTVGIVVPINPLLSPEQIAGILNESGARVVVGLASFLKTDIAQKTAKALAGAPKVEVLLEVDLRQYLSPLASLVVALKRPKIERPHKARVLNFEQQKNQQPGDRLLAGTATDRDTVSAYFHTGGTTGLPKLARHRQGNMLYMGWVAQQLLYRQGDVLLCALPLFHVFAAYAMIVASLCGGVHSVLLCPAGFRTEGIMPQFWKLVERYKATFMMAVPTAFAALRQQPVDADVSTLRHAVSGAASMPVELLRSFEEATGLKILEGYGQTEATCVVSLNPPDGDRVIGSVGQPLPYTMIRAVRRDSEGPEPEFCAPGEVGEIVTRGPHVFGGYLQEDRNKGLIIGDGWLRTGDLGRVEEGSWVWITGRVKDVIIRGGHNIDPEIVEEALAGHPAVALVAAVGQPDPEAGELPVAFVLRVEGSEVDAQELYNFAAGNIGDAVARPASIRFISEMPMTAVGKIYKPELRKILIKEVLEKALEAENVQSYVNVNEDPKAGLVATIVALDEKAAGRIAGAYPVNWKFELMYVRDFSK